MEYLAQQINDSMFINVVLTYQGKRYQHRKNGVRRISFVLTVVILFIVFSFFPLLHPMQPLFASPNGWQIQQTAIPNSSNPGYLNDTKAISDNNVWAVGGYLDQTTGTTRTLTEQNTGQGWQVIPSVDLVTTQPSTNGNRSTNTLNAVTATAADDVWAAGEYQAIQGEQENTLLEHWDGNSWSVVSSPNPGLFNVFYGVTALSRTDAWAVGDYFVNTQGDRPLIEHWDGANWNVVEQPLGFGDSTILYGVAAINANDVWAVGSVLPRDGSQQAPLLEHWDGTSWSVVSSPPIGTGLNANLLQRVTALASNNVWAVGSYTASDNTVKTLVEHWDGNTWSIVPTPDTNNLSTQLASIFPLGPNDIWAAGGTFIQASKSDIGIIEHWDGTVWTIVQSPSGPQSNGRTFDFLSGITGTTNNLWAVGQDATGTLIETTSLPLFSNQPPIVQAFSGAPIAEGKIYTTSSSFTDPDSTSWTGTVDYGDGSEVQPLTLNPDKTFSLSHQYAEEGSYTVHVAITDNQGATGTQTAQVIVSDATPTINMITVSNSVIQVNTSITATASFTDAPGDTHTATWNWGDGSTTRGTVTEQDGSGTVSDTHTYTQAGVYTVILTVQDDENVSSSQTFQYVVAYNPTGGFLTGEGKYNSLAGWDTQNTNASGEVKFGISAQYQPGSNIPTGQVKVNFKVGNLDFSGTSFQWLVINGSAATLKGNGTINGTGNYTILISAIDGSQNGGASFVRIKITDSSNNVIYDTQAGAADTANPTTALTSGSIKIH